MLDITKASCRTSPTNRDERHRLVAEASVPSVLRRRKLTEEAAMYGSMGPDLTRARMQDRMREAEVYRLTKETRAARAGAHRLAARRVVRTALTTLLWPVKH